MEKPKYERAADSNLLTLKESVAVFNLSKSTIDKIARQCGAKLRIGRCARYRRDILQEHLNTFTVYGGDNA